MPDNGCDVVVVGASAGGVEALKGLARALPADFGAPILVVLHVPPTGTSVLPQILSRAGALPAVHATHGEQLERGRIYIAPPDCHLLIANGKLELDHGPRENGHRPAIDTLFRSAAAAYGGRTAGVVLSGTLDDGTEGLHVIKSRGGATLVQDPGEAVYPSMPTSAIRHVEPDYVLPIAKLADVLVRLATAGNDSPRAPDPEGAEALRPG